MKMNQETKMLGCSSTQLEEFYKSTYNINMVLAGMLSDAQELISNGDKENANIILNKVKYYFFEFTDTRNETPDLIKTS
jgi:hypothetical protein